MKTVMTILVFISMYSMTAQQGINYKALVKDGAGDVLSNQTVGIQFTIFEGVAQTNVYEETHTVTTDANGIAIAVIGNGTTMDTFSDIDWNVFNHSLNVQVDSGAGLTDLGTTTFNAVPYAMTTSNVQGLELIDEGNGMGWRLSGFNPDKYGNIGEESVDFSISSFNSTVKGATGDNSVAFGKETRAVGELSVAFGSDTFVSGFAAMALGVDTAAEGTGSFVSGNGSRAVGTAAMASGSLTSALGNNSFAIGRSSEAIAANAFATGDFTLATGETSTTFGFETRAEGDHSMALGINTRARAQASMAIGRYNIGTGTGDDWIETESLFEIGNGVSSGARSNALTVLKNGTITAPSLDISEITDDKALITKEYADANLSSSGLEALNEGNNIGWRIIGRDPNDFGSIGDLAVDLSFSSEGENANGATGPASFAVGRNTRATGVYSTTMGDGTTASGSAALAIGSNTTASGDNSFAIGDDTTADGKGALAGGFITTANGDYSFAGGIFSDSDGNFSFASGYSSQSDSYAGAAFGTYNVGGGDPVNPVLTDPLFEIGNGTSEGTRSNAFTVLKNGKVGLGVHQPSAFLEISSVNSSGQPTVKLIHEGTTGSRITFTDTGVTNGNRWTLYGDADDNDAASIFNIFHPNKGNILRIQGNGEVGVNGLPNTELHVYHGTSGSSDGFKLENEGGNGNWWRMYTVNSSGHLNLYSENQGATSVGNFDNVSGAYTSTSDRRLKKNFKELHFNWKDFMKLEALTYQYKVQKENKEHIGLVAQDVEEIYPELVNYNEEEDIYHLNYSGFGVVAIKAIQEQQDIIENQKARIEALEAKLSEREITNNELKDRVSKIEKVLEAMQ